MPTNNDRFGNALRLIDEANGADPNPADDGRPFALAYGQRMSEQLNVFDPAAGEALRLAVRAQHLERWAIPRERYPDGRTGYLRWRSDLKRYHAERCGELLERVGYDKGVVRRVGDLLQKKKLRSDPETQTLEDVACLVFLRYYAVEFVGQHPAAKVDHIMNKTWGKMSDAGRTAARKLDLPAGVATLVARMPKL